MKMRYIFGHLVFWAVIMLTYAISEWGYRDNFRDAMLFEFLFLPVRLTAVYINWFLLIPRLLYKNRILLYLMQLAALLILLAIAQRYFVLYWGYPVFFPEWVTRPPDPLVFSRIVQNVVIIASPVAFSTGIKIFMDWYKQKNRAKQLEIEKQEAELKYLKAQINPHFLFNTLNNLYGLSMEQSNKVPGLILKLSDFLSYSLYESYAEKMSIEKEINLIKGFIDLEADRYEDRIKVNWAIDESTYNMQIAALLFMPLVENAFKHGVQEEIGKAFIEIKLTKKNNWLVFEIVNSIAGHEQKKDAVGIGLNNLKRRLQLLYQERHVLETYKKGHLFFAILKINMDE